MPVIYLDKHRRLTEEQKNDFISFFSRVAKETGLEKVEEWTMTVDMFLDSLKKS